MDFSGLTTPQKIDKSEEVGSSQRAVVGAVVHNVIPTLNAVIDYLQRLKAHVGSNESDVEELRQRVDALEERLEAAEESSLPSLDALDNTTEEKVREAGITNGETLTQKTDDELLGIDGIGPTRLEDIRDLFPASD